MAENSSEDSKSKTDFFGYLNKLKLVIEEAKTACEKAQNSRTYWNKIQMDTTPSELTPRNNPEAS